MLAANLLQRERPPGLSRAPVLGGGFLQIFRKIVHIDEFIYGSEASTGNHVFEFANVARPAMLVEDSLSSSRKASDLFAIGLVVFLEEILNEQGNIIEALGQVRDADLNRAEAIEQVLAKAAGEHLGA